MNTQIPNPLDIHSLLDEVRRYLVVVEVFRAEGHEPCWSPERPVPAPRTRPRRRRALGAPPLC